MDHLTNLLTKPVKPQESECCGLGCKPCVFDIYEKELNIWENCIAKEEIKSEFTMSADIYTTCEIERVEMHCCDVQLFHFKLPNKTNLTFSAGQHVIARESTPDGTIVRPYTLISQPGIVGEFSVLIKTSQEGKMSRIISNKWVPGYSVAWRGPVGTLNYQPNRYRNILLIAAGTGIAPLYQLAKLILGNEDDETRLTLFYCCKNYRSVILHDDIHCMQRYWNFDVTYFLSDDSNRDADQLRRHNERIVYGRLSRSILSEELEKIRNVNDVGVFLCGSKTFESEITGYLVDCRVNSSLIITF